MTAAPTGCLRHNAPGNRSCRTIRTLSSALAFVLAAGIFLLPARMVLADQILELPPTGAPDVTPPPPESTTRPETARKVMAPMPADLGSIDDYENQDEPTRRSSNNAFASANAPLNVPFDPNRNRAALTNEVILSVLAIGLYTLEARSANQHHHR